MFETITIVGVGLIGGSIGLAARQRGVASQVLGLGRNASTLERARSKGAISTGYLDTAAALKDAERVVICTPVDRIARQVLELAPLCRPGCFVTDAGSTKGKIVADLESHLSAEVKFVGSHPLAGAEKSGVEHARADLFHDHLTVVTRTAA